MVVDVEILEFEHDHVMRSLLAMERARTLHEFELIYSRTCYVEKKEIVGMCRLGISLRCNAKDT